MWVKYHNSYVVHHKKGRMLRHDIVREITNIFIFLKIQLFALLNMLMEPYSMIKHHITTKYYFNKIQCQKFHVL